MDDDGPPYRERRLGFDTQARLLETVVLTLDGGDELVRRMQQAHGRIEEGVMTVGSWRGRRAVTTLLSAVLVLSGCAVSSPSSDPCARGGERAGEASPSKAELRAAMHRVIERVYEVPGVGSSFVDDEAGRMVFEVASGDDGGARTCATLAGILDETGMPYDLQVFEAPTESTSRKAVPVTVAWAGEGPSLRLEVASCNGSPEVTALEETADDVRIEITATIAQEGWPSQACVDTMTVLLEAPRGERTLIDLTTSEIIFMHSGASD